MSLPVLLPRRAVRRLRPRSWPARRHRAHRRPRPPGRPIPDRAPGRAATPA